MYMLDTDICSYILKHRPVSVLEKFSSIKTSAINISVVTVAELFYGVNKNPSKKIDMQVVEKFISHLTILDWDMNAAAEYSKIRCELEKKGKIIGNMDMMIAAHTLSAGLILVSNNLRHFANITKLKTENWV